MTNEKFARLFGGERRLPETRITKREMDMAASVQKVVEEILILTARYAKSLVGEETDNLVLAGGVALNCVANGKLQKQKIFQNIWVQPAAGDAGGALGAALYYYYWKSGKGRVVDGNNDRQKGSYLGSAYAKDKIERWLIDNHYPYEKYEEQNTLCKK